MKRYRVTSDFFQTFIEADSEGAAVTQMVELLLPEMEVVDEGEIPQCLTCGHSAALHRDDADAFCAFVDCKCEGLHLDVGDCGPECSSESIKTRLLFTDVSFAQREEPCENCNRKLKHGFYVSRVKVPEEIHFVCTQRCGRMFFSTTPVESFGERLDQELYDAEVEKTRHSREHAHPKIHEGLYDLYMSAQKHALRTYREPVRYDGPVLP